jgi:hypothetical protein
VLTTKAISCVNAISSIGGGEVLLDGGSPVITRGICWGANPQPTILDNTTSDGVGLGAFTSILNNLQPNTTYYFRAYATNSVGTGYGNELSFSTTADTILQVGCYYRGGIIAYILQDGDPGYDPNVQHGLIVSPEMPSTLAAWGCAVNGLIIAANYAIGGGAQNTLEIVSACNETGFAAKRCADLVLNGYDDWFLPSYNEMDKIVQYNLSYSVGYPSGGYWTSTGHPGNSIQASTRLLPWGNAQWDNRGVVLNYIPVRYF